MYISMEPTFSIQAIKRCGSLSIPLAEFNRYTNSPVANYKGEMYNMPFNMNTFSKMWNISTPAQAKAIIEEQKKKSRESRRTWRSRLSVW